MARILFVEQDKEIRTLISTAIKGEFRVFFIAAEDAREAIKILENEKFDMVLTRGVINQQRTGSSIANYKKKNPDRVPHLLILDDEEFDVDGVYNLPIPYDHADLVSKVNAVLTEAKVHTDKENVPPYIPFELVFFKNMKTTPCDLYLKMIRSDGAHYVKRYRSKDNIDQDIIDKYAKGDKVKYFFVEAKDRFAFFNHMVNICFEYICKAKASEVHLTIGRHAENYQIIQDMVNVFGIEEETIRVCDQTIKKMLDHVRQFNQLNDLLRKVLSSPGSYMYKHCYLNLLMTAHLLPALKWSGEKHFELVMEKMCYAIFFHDICLQDDKLVAIANKIDFYKAENLTPKERELVKNHANMAATLLQRYQGLPSGVDIIVKQHHGTTNGIGFTDYYKASISQMSVMFIILEEFVGQVLNYHTHKQGILEIIDKMSRKFEQPTYLRIVQALKDSVMNPQNQKERINKKRAKGKNKKAA
jgi:response regulator RpfG family c-di-GMP phosphodiesterase